MNLKNNKNVFHNAPQKHCMNACPDVNSKEMIHQAMDKHLHHKKN